MGRFIGTAGVAQTLNLTDDIIIKDITVTAGAAATTVSILSNAVQQELIACPVNDTRALSYYQADMGNGLRIKAPATVTIVGAASFVRIEW